MLELGVGTALLSCHTLGDCESRLGLARTCLATRKNVKTMAICRYEMTPSPWRSPYALTLSAFQTVTVVPDPVNAAEATGLPSRTRSDQNPY